MKFKRIIALLLVASLVFTNSHVSAKDNKNSGAIITFGEDLNLKDKEKILEFLGIDVEKRSLFYVTEITQQDELALSEDNRESNLYGCSIVQPTSSGGLKVKTANTSDISKDMLVTAMITAGIYNCNVISASPSSVSGLSSIVEILKGYESLTNVVLEESDKALAIKEVEMLSYLNKTYNCDVVETYNNIKLSVINGSPYNIKKSFQTLGASLSSKDEDMIEGFMKSLKGVGISEDNFTNALKGMDSLDDELKKFKEDMKSKEGLTGFFNNLFSVICDFFSSVGGFFKSIFSDTEDSSMNKEVESIFKNVDTSIYSWDD